MKDNRIAVVGLGYVGLPLAVAFSRHYPVVGFDIDKRRVQSLEKGVDSTNEVASDALQQKLLTLTSDPSAMRDCNIFIVTVPTPIDQANRPDLGALVAACELIGPNMSEGSIVVFESTVYPGVTEEICAPALERASGMKSGEGFKLGYSPERINPGDKERPIEKIVKVVAGSDPETLDHLADLYGSIIEAGIHRASSIKVAEAAKVIENTQRDVNIALMNEISKICGLLDIRSSEVLAAAGTKWNFMKFHPGLVGGHCIGVDPYYLTAKAEQLGYHPEVILSGRRVNDSMGAYVAQRLVKLLAANGQGIRDAKVGILGFTFKENVPDIRNSKVVDIHSELLDFGVAAMAHDALADAETVRNAYGVELTGLERFKDLAGLVYAVPHESYEQLDGDALSAMIAPNGIFVDVKSRVDPTTLRADIRYWSL